MHQEACVQTFPLLDAYLGIRLDVDAAALEPDRPRVVESARRTRCETGATFIHGLWWLRWADGRSVVSVPPGAGPAVQALVRTAVSAQDLHDPHLAQSLVPVISRHLPVRNRVFRRLQPMTDLCFACNSALLKRHTLPGCTRLHDTALPLAGSLRFPFQCFPGGVVYGVVRDGHVVAMAYAHRTGVMARTVCDVAVETAISHRRRGFGAACVAALTAHFADRGGETRYYCRPTNKASIATARSTGYVPYATSLVIAALP